MDFESIPCNHRSRIILPLAPILPFRYSNPKEDQYLNCFKLGLHKGKYKALVQAKPLTVIRNYNRDSVLNYNSGKEEPGMFGINIHCVKLSGTAINVNK